MGEEKETPSEGAEEKWEESTKIAKRLVKRKFYPTVAARRSGRSTKGVMQTLEGTTQPEMANTFGGV
ncbi:unnamed protein product [Urochloa humidicola]